MRKGIFTTLLLTITMFCAAQSGLTTKTPDIQQTGTSGQTDVSSISGNKDTTRTRASSVATCGTSTVTDASGNVYSTVQIGDQCWMAENLRVGTMIDGLLNQTVNGVIEKHCYNNNPANCITYGGLYQWNEMMLENGQGICPAGWHVPGNGEWGWLNLLLYGDAAGKMKTTGTLEGGTGLWHEPNTAATNSSGFNAVPGGQKDGAGNFEGLGYAGFFYSTTPWWYDFKYFFQLSYNSGEMANSYQYPSYSMSVRCLKNTITAALPTVSTSPVTGITAITAVSGGTVIDDNGAPVTARGVVWSTTSGPTIDNNQGITSNGTGSGGFASDLAGLSSGTAYFVKAYATNSVGTAYGAELQFIAAIPSILNLSGMTIGTGTNSCFDATQTIAVSNVTVQTGGTATFIAGGNILMQPATIVQNGGHLHASITTTQNYCVQPASMIQSGSEQTTAGVQKIELQDASAFFTIFPNPVTGKFTLEMHDFDAMQAVQVEICTMMGKRILQSELPARQKHEFDATGWPKGVYLIRVIKGNGMSVRKLVRQ